MKISFEAASRLKYKPGVVYAVSFYDGYVDGSKYDVEAMDTSYMSYTPVLGFGLYFTTVKEAQELVELLNTRGK